MTCTHHWLCEPPQGPRKGTPARCKHCGAARTFRDSGADFQYGNAAAIYAVSDNPDRLLRGISWVGFSRWVGR